MMKVFLGTNGVPVNKKCGGTREGIARLDILYMIFFFCKSNGYFRKRK